MAALVRGGRLPLGSPCLEGCSLQLLPAPYLEGRFCPDPSPATMSKCLSKWALRGVVWVDALANRVATVYTNAPNQRREAVFANLCTLLRPHGRSRDRAGPRVPRHRRPHGPRATQVFGPEARPTGAVTQPPTHTNSRSLPKCGIHHIFYLYNVIQITFRKGWNGQRRSKELGYLAGVAPS